MEQEGTRTSPSISHVPDACSATREVLARVGDKWSMLVVVLLGDGPRRFNELKRMIDGISQRMLSLTLKNLERDGLVRRTVTPSIPPRVDYELTALGVSLHGPVEELGRWAQAHQMVGPVRESGNCGVKRFLLLFSKRTAC